MGRAVFPAPAAPADAFIVSLPDADRGKVLPAPAPLPAALDWRTAIPGAAGAAPAALAADDATLVTTTVGPLVVEERAAATAAAALDRAALAPATRRVYRQSLARFDAWRWRWKRGAVVDDALLADYCATLYAAGAAPATVDLAVAAVRTAARLFGADDPVGPATTWRRRGARRSGSGRGRGQSAGIGWRAADRLADRAAAEGSLQGARDAAIIAVASDAALRVSEVAALDCGDFDAGDDRGGTLTIRRAKTDQAGRGTVHSLGVTTVVLVQAWQAAADVRHGPLFRGLYRGGKLRPGPMSATSVARMIARRAADAGIEGATGHALRIGAAQSLVDHGATTADLQAVGRWTTERMPAHYSRLQRARRDPVARLRYGGRQ